MADLAITEYSEKARDINGYPVEAGQEPAEAIQHVTFTTAAASSAFGNKTKFIRLKASAACFVVFGAAPVATANHTPLAADVAEYFGVKPGQKVSVYDGSS